jgi:hypothetical protein
MLRVPRRSRRRPPAEEREVCAWAAFRIRIEEMISTNVVLIHRPLDQPHAESLGVEAVVFSNRRRDRSEMMSAGKFHAVTKAIVLNPCAVVLLIHLRPAPPAEQDQARLTTGPLLAAVLPNRAAQSA